MAAMTPALLRGVWAEVLELSEAELDALTNDTPFGSFGGDSMLAVTMAATAARHGLTLHMKGVNVFVYEGNEARGFKRISSFEVPGASRTVRVLYGGRVHYDALVT